MRAIALGICLSILLTTTPAAAQVLDIRGLTLDASIDLVLDANVLDETLHVETGPMALPALPHSFDIAPDPDAPGDPGRIVIRTRLPSGPDDTDDLQFELYGTFDAATGAIEAEGAAYGMHFWQTPFETDAFGLLDSLASVWLQMRDPQMTLHAVVTVGAADTTIMGFDIVGGSGIGPFQVAAELELNATRVSWLPYGTDDVNLALFGPYEITEVTSAITDLYAHVVDVFGDVDDDMMLTQADVIEIHKLFGPVLDEDYEGDLTADGIVDMQDADYLQWLVRCIGNTDVDCGPVLVPSAGQTGTKPKGKPQ